MDRRRQRQETLGKRMCCLLLNWEPYGLLFVVLATADVSREAIMSVSREPQGCARRTGASPWDLTAVYLKPNVWRLFLRFLPCTRDWNRQGSGVQVGSRRTGHETASAEKLVPRRGGGPRLGSRLLVCLAVTAWPHET